MLKKRSFYVGTLLLGIILVGLSFAFGDDMKQISGLLIGSGAAAFGMSIAQIYNLTYEKNHPELVRQNEIEIKDERNTMIRYRAKAKAGNIIHWMIIGIAYIMILFDLPLWAVLVTIGVFLLYDILSMYFMSKAY